MEITDEEAQKIIIGIVSGHNGIDEPTIHRLAEMAVKQLSDARSDIAMIELVMEGKLVITGERNGELVFKKA